MHKKYEYKGVFSEKITDYISARRKAGFLFDNPAYWLFRFDQFCCSNKIQEGFISKQLFDAWASRNESETKTTQCNRLEALKNFSVYLNTVGISSYIPLNLPRPEKTVPYLMTDHDIREFFLQVDLYDTCTTKDSFKRMALEYKVLFRLIYCCGLRNNEACSLRTENMSLPEGYITIYQSKGSKDRIVYLSDDLRILCSDYLDWLYSKTGSIPEWFFPGRDLGMHIPKTSVDRKFNEFWNATSSSESCDKKPTVHCDMPVHADAKDFLECMDRFLGEHLGEYQEEYDKEHDKEFDKEYLEGQEGHGKACSLEGSHRKYVFEGINWITECQSWKKQYPVVLPKHYEDTNRTNVYAFIKELSSRLEEGRITVVGNGSACVVGSHGYVIKKGQRFIINSAIASMGYDLPAAIGACVAEYGNRALRRYRSGIWQGKILSQGMGTEGIGPDGKKKDMNIDPDVPLTDGTVNVQEEHLKDIILVTGDGSIQMNLQELQTIIHHQMPIKIFIINNNGYHSIRQTQQNFFGEPLVGIGYDRGALSFPIMERLAYAYGYPYYCIDGNEQLAPVLDDVLSKEGPLICEVFVSAEQKFEPKSATMRLDDGRLVSPPLEDLAPFLPREELKTIMKITLME